MINRFTFRVDEDKGLARYTLSGSITEASDFSPLLGRQDPRVVIDLMEVERINSGGVGVWVSFITSLSAPPREVILDRCSAPMVHQLNMISNMRGRARVRSVMLPYLCADCGYEYHGLLNLEVAPPSSITKASPCPQCGGTMEFDDLAEMYFSFHEVRR